RSSVLVIAEGLPVTARPHQLDRSCIGPSRLYISKSPERQPVGAFVLAHEHLALAVAAPTAQRGEVDGVRPVVVVLPLLLVGRIDETGCLAAHVRTECLVRAVVDAPVSDLVDLRRDRLTYPLAPERPRA